MNEMIKKLIPGDDETCSVCLKENAEYIISGRNRSCGVCGNQISFCKPCLIDFSKKVDEIEKQDYGFLFAEAAR